MPSDTPHHGTLIRPAIGVEPIRLRPFLRPAPWGGRRLIEHYGKPLPHDANGELFGESWEVSGHPLHVSQVVEGSATGQTLNALWSEHSADWTGGAHAADSNFPLLVKLLDCREPCSVQVHPGQSGSLAMDPPQQVKIEAWIVLEAFADAKIYAGFHQGISEADVRQALDSGTIAECLHAVTPNVGDCFLMTPGIVHAMQGVLLAEFQTTSDATLRLFDWNRTDQNGRPRKLHIEESLREIDFARGPVHPVVPRPLLNPEEQPVESEVLVEIPEFHLTRHRLRGTWSTSENRAVSIWMAIDGEAGLSINGQPPCSISCGETLLVPPHESLEWSAFGEQPATLLECELPG